MDMTPRTSASYSYTLSLLCILLLVIVGCSAPTISTESDKPATPDGPLTTFDISPGNALIYMERYRDAYQYDWAPGLKLMGAEWIFGETGAQTLVRRLGGTESVRDSLRMVNGSFFAARYPLIREDGMIKVASFTDKEGTVLSTWKEKYNNGRGKIETLSCTITCVDPDTLVSMTMGSDTTSLHRISISRYRKTNEVQAIGATEFEGILYFSPKYGLVHEEHKKVTLSGPSGQRFLNFELTYTLWALKRI